MSGSDAAGGEPALALAGLRVLELGHPATAYCGKLLADLGADVIKVEPSAGSAERRLGPFHADIPHPERGLPYLFLNTNKRGITLNLDTADGRALFRRLAATADAIVEGCQPGQLAAWGLDYAALAAAHPALVLASITGFGQAGPYSAYLAPDLIAFAVGGLMYLSGDPAHPPVTAPCAQAYLVGSLHAAVSVLTALWGRRATDRGDHADVSIQACLAAQENSLANRYSQGARRPTNCHGASSPGRAGVPRGWVRRRSRARRRAPCGGARRAARARRGSASQGRTWPRRAPWWPPPSRRGRPG
jgi:crotonobetainyl-CoA:carnitine CoA-transferase CaiB-like acyl-CoA transferase